MRRGVRLLRLVGFVNSWFRRWLRKWSSFLLITKEGKSCLRRHSLLYHHGNLIIYYLTLYHAVSSL